METSFDPPQPWRSDMPKERQAKSFKVPSSIIDNESYTTKNIPDAPVKFPVVVYWIKFDSQLNIQKNAKNIKVVPIKVLIFPTLTFNTANPNLDKINIAANTIA